MSISKEVKDAISATVSETLNQVNSISWIDRQNKLKESTLKNTEKILYSFNTLKDYISNEDEYLDMAFKEKSGSIISYSKNKTPKVDEDQRLETRRASYLRSKRDVEFIENALDRIKHRKGYEVIEFRYLKRKENDVVYTFEEITEILSGKDGYSNNLNEKTVRTYKNILVNEIAIQLFGSDAI